MHNLLRHAVRHCIVDCRVVGLIRQVVQHHAQLIYTRATKGPEA